MRRLALVLVLFVAACAAPKTKQIQVEDALVRQEAHKQRVLVVKDYLDKSARLYRLDAALKLAAADLCREQDRLRALAGVFTANRHAGEDEWRAAYADLGYGEALRMVDVVPDLPAARAGLRPGDEILAANGQPTSGKDAMKNFAEAMEDTPPGQPLALRVRRDGRVFDASVPTVAACDYPTALVVDRTLNAWADGERIVVTTAMAEFTRTDEELALILAHELSHNIMEHIDAKRANALGAGFGGLLLDVLAAAGGVNTGGAFTNAAMEAGANAYSVEFEQEADYVGTYILKRAGFSVDGVADFWRRMAIADPRSIGYGETHPTAPARFLAMERIIDEVNAKAAAGQPLVPEMKEED